MGQGSPTEGGEDDLDRVAVLQYQTGPVVRVDEAAVALHEGSVVGLLEAVEELDQRGPWFDFLGLAVDGDGDGGLPIGERSS